MFLLLFLFPLQHPRYKLLRYSKERQYIDGLNNLIYVPTVLVDRLYTNISVNLTPELAPIEDYWRSHCHGNLDRDAGHKLRVRSWRRSVDGRVPGPLRSGAGSLSDPRVGLPTAASFLPSRDPPHAPSERSRDQVPSLTLGVKSALQKKTFLYGNL